MTKILTALLCAVALLPASASARPFDSTEDSLYRLAEQYWVHPSGGCTYITREVVDQSELEGNRLGEAAGCWMRVAQQAFQDLRTGCLVVAHELGHVYGFGHSEDPTSVMYPVISPTTMVDHYCDDPLASISLLPPRATPAWPGEGEELRAWGQRLTAHAAGCRGRHRCRVRVREGRRRLRAAWAAWQLKAESEPIGV